MSFPAGRHAASDCYADGISKKKMDRFLGKQEK
jgi:hypothetical protein